MNRENVNYYANHPDCTVTRKEFIDAYERVIRVTIKDSKQDLVFDAPLNPLADFKKMFSKDYRLAKDPKQVFPILCKYRATHPLAVETSPVYLFCQLIGLEFTQVFNELHLIARVRIT